MKTKKFSTGISLCLLFLFSVAPVALASGNSEGETLSAEAKILSIESKRAGRTRKNIATVQFKTEKGQVIRTRTDLLRIPYVGSFSKKGDTITVHYEKNKPAIAYSFFGNLVNKYGLILLIAVGVIISLWRIASIYKKQNASA